jgi:hypothetical protein
MFSYENYIPFTAFNESSLFFKASEVFRYGFLLDSVEEDFEFRQLYSYYNYYVEIVYADNYEEIKTIRAISINEALSKYVDDEIFSAACIDLFTA